MDGGYFVYTKQNTMNKHILLIESERIISLDLKYQLEKNGYSVHKPKLSEMEVVINQMQMDLIIADINVKQQIDCEKILKLVGNNIPVICTDVEDGEKINEIPYMNIIGTFPKPFDSSDIVARTNEYFTKRAC